MLNKLSTAVLSARLAGAYLLLDACDWVKALAERAAVAVSPGIERLECAIAHRETSTAEA